jgi:uncharacterized protein DUF3606
MFSLWRRNLREERDSHHRDHSGVTPATSRFGTPFLRVKMMISRKPTYFRNSLDLRDKVQVKVLRRRLKLTDEQLASIVRKSGKSISAITKEAAAKI